MVGIELKTANVKGHMTGHPGDGVVLNFLNRARGVVRYGLSPTIQTDGGGSSGVITMNDRIRKLTEKECFRLMGFNDLEIDALINARNEKNKPVFCRTELYRFAGNSVVVNCFTAILEDVIKDMNNGPRKDTLDAWVDL